MLCQLMLSKIKGGDRFVLLESPYGLILPWDKLGKRALQVEEVAKSHQSADITFVFQFALCFRKKTPVWISWEQNEKGAAAGAEREGMTEEGPV